MSEVIRRIKLLNFRVLSFIAVIQVIIIISARFFLQDTGFIVFSLISGVIAAFAYWDMTKQK